MFLPLCLPCLYLLIFHPVFVACSCSNASTTCPGSSINISWPFTTDPQCRGAYLIHCHGSTPTIQFDDDIEHSYTIVHIYENLLRVQDPDLSKLMQGSNWNFLYEFIEPYPHLDLAHLVRYLALKNSSNLFNCSSTEYDFSYIFDGLNNFTHCEGYNLHYLLRLENQSIDSYCRPSSPPLFEEGNDGLALRYAGFSKQLVLHKECFRCHIVSGQCTGDDGCGCSDICSAAQPAHNATSRKMVKSNIIIGIVYGNNQNWFRPDRNIHKKILKPLTLLYCTV